MTKVLVVDDNIDLLRLIELKLTQEGYSVYLAENGFDGLKKSVEISPDVVILDVMMPEMDGWEFCERMRETSNVPILMLTARSEDEDVIRGLKLGADEYLTKPFRLNTLSARVEALLRRRHWEETAVTDEVDALKKSITNAVSHELRTPVALILNALDLALREAFRDDPTAQREFIMDARQNAVALRWLIDDLLMLVRIDQGLNVLKKPILVYPQLQQLFNGMDSALKQRSLNARYSCPEGLSVSVEQVLFRQAIHHLFTNAIKYTPDGGNIMVVAEETDDGMLNLDFHDQGPGIEPDLHERIFERFYQPRSDQQRKYGGLGVGLSIARAIARAHGGDITVHSAPGEGSTFRLSVPTGMADEAPAG
jgi:signal transduction histidine kinase